MYGLNTLCASNQVYCLTKLSKKFKGFREKEIKVSGGLNTSNEMFIWVK